MRAAAAVAVSVVIATVDIQTAVAERHGMAEVNRLLTPDLYTPPGENDTGALKVHQGYITVLSGLQCHPQMGPFPPSPSL